MHIKAASLLVGLLVLVGLAPASYAQYSVPSQASQADSESVTMIVDDRKPPQIAVDEKLKWELGASLNFITSDPSLGDTKLSFTDVMLLRLHTLITLGRYDLFFGTDILPKQPSYTEELVWQGALAGIRTTLGKSASVWVRGQGGPQLGREGYWLNAETAVKYHYALQRELFFETSLGWSHSQLSFKDEVDRFFFVEEVFTQVGLALRDPRRGKFAAWLTFDYYLPVLGGPANDDPDPITGASLDPQPRVNVHIGALGAITDNVDLFVEYSILDRGDLEDRRTTLPILHAGFDQKQLIFGFMRHFGRDRR